MNKGCLRGAVGVVMAFAVAALLALPHYACLRLVARFGRWSDARRRRAVSRAALLWSGAVLRLWSVGAGPVVWRLPAAPVAPSIVVANHRSMFDFLVLAVACRRLGLDNVRWVTRDFSRNWFLAWLMKDVCVFVKSRAGSKADLAAVTAAAEEANESGASFVIFPEGRLYDPSRASPDWVGVMPPKVGGFRCLCAGLPDHGVVTLAVLWQGPGGLPTWHRHGRRPLLAVVGQSSGGLPDDSAAWLHEEWRRLEATIISLG